MDDDDQLQTRSYELEESVLLFPEPDDVFADPIDQHARHLHPIASIELSTVSEQLSGWVHLVLPIDPFGEYLGSYTAPFHNEYVSENWISFRVEHGRYRFLGDFRYFFVENDDVPEPYPNHRGDLKAHYVKQQASYEERKQIYRRDGWKYGPDDPSRQPLYQFRDRAWNHNWAQYPPPPGSYQVVESGENDRFAGVSTTDGRELLFVASAQGFQYRDYGANEVILFYDPVEQIAIQTFDW